MVEIDAEQCDPCRGNRISKIYQQLKMYYARITYDINTDIHTLINVTFMFL